MQVDHVISPPHIPQDTASSVFSESPCRTHNVALSYFFSTATPFTFVQNLLSRTFSALRFSVCYTLDSLFSLCKDTCLKVYVFFVSFFSRCFRSDLVANILSRVINYFLKDNNYEQKIDTYKKQLELKSANSVYAETTKVIQAAILQSFDTYVVHAQDVDREARPDFVSHSILVETGQDESEYRLCPKLGILLFQKKQELFKRVIECNLLKIFCHIVDLLLEVQGQNRYALLDLTLDATQKISMHFHECTNRDEAIRQNTNDVQEVVQESAVLEKNKTLFFQVLADTVMRLGFPQGAKDLDLPFSQTISSYISAYIFDLIKNEILPEALQTLYAKQSTPFCKEYLFYKFFKLLHEGIDKPHQTLEAKQEHVVIQYPRQKEMIHGLYDSVDSFLKYIDPNFLPWILKSIAPDKVAHFLATSLSQKLQNVTLQESFAMILEQALPRINTGGTWVEQDGKQEFKMAPFTFTTERGQKQRYLADRAQKIEKRKKAIEEFIVTIGKDPKGLQQLMQSHIYAPVDATSTRDAATPQNSWLTSIKTSVSSLLGTASQQVVNGACYLADVSNKIQALNRALWEKMKQSQHELVTFDLTRSVVTFLRPKIVFPELRNWILKKPLDLF